MTHPFIEQLLWADSIGQLILILLRDYLLFTLSLTIALIIHMYAVERKANDRKRGRARIDALLSAGRYRQIPLYTNEEIQDNKALGVVRLTVFPNDTGEKKKYAIVCPGGGYAHLCTKQEGYPVAAYLNELGYTAFLLEYRTGRKCSPHAPMHDLYRAVKHITEHADEYNVEKEDYAVIGFSAGGNLAGIYGSAIYGFEKYGTIKPGALIMGYPWTNVNHWLSHPYWNPWQALLSVWVSERCNWFMFGFPTKKADRESLCVQNFITETYPPVFMYAGGQDILVPAWAHMDVLEKALKTYGVPYEYKKYFRIPHGIGLGVNTEADGWLDEAVAFWVKTLSEREARG